MIHCDWHLKLPYREEIQTWSKYKFFYECMDSENHNYVEFLELFLVILNCWKAEWRINKKPNEFEPLTLFQSYLWMLYGIKGVAKQISRGCTMIKWAGGKNNLEHKFDNFPEKKVIQLWLIHETWWNSKQDLVLIIVQGT